MTILTVEKVGELLGITFSDTTIPTDTQVKKMIIDSEKYILSYISIYYYEIEITNYIPLWIKNTDNIGEANGTNTVFYIPHIPIVDYDSDGNVTDDVTITIYDEDTDTWSINVEKTSVDQRTGKVILSSAPPNNARVFATFRTYISSIPDNNLLSELVFYDVAQKIWRIAKFELLDELIESYSVDGVSINKSKSNVIKEAVNKYKDDFNHVLRIILQGKGGVFYG